MARTAYLSAFAAAALLASADANAQDIRTAAQDSSEPKFIAATVGGQHVIIGLCIDIMRAIEHEDPSLHFVGDQRWMPLPRIEHSVQTGVLDAACGLLRNKDRETRLRYIEPELFPVRYHLAVRSDDPVQIENWDDVRKLGDKGVILTLSGSGEIKRLQEVGGLIIDAQAMTPLQNLQKLHSGHGRFFLQRYPGLDRDIRQAGLVGKIKVLPAVMDGTSFYLVLGKHVSQDTVERLQKAIISLTKRGELAKIAEKWN